MMVPMTNRLRWHDARALRFLILCIGGWTAVRVVATWNPAVPIPEPVPYWQPAPTDRGIVGVASAEGEGFDPPVMAALAPDVGKGRRLSPAVPRRDSARRSDPAPTAVNSAQPTTRGNRWFSDQRHFLRFAMAARFLAGSPGGMANAAVPAGRQESPWRAALAVAGPPPATGTPFWITRDMGGWSLASWLYLRQGSSMNGAPLGNQLGGSQAGTRIAYGFGETGRTRAFARLTVATAQWQQRELSLGLAFAPVARLPIDIAVEQRLALGRQGRTALAVSVIGGVSDVRLPGRFRLDAYGQAGIVGAHRRDGFADGAVVVDHAIGEESGAVQLRAGALAAAAVQPQVTRVDVGPRLSLRLPEIGQGSRIALDWRQRVTGDARPAGGLALTLATDF